MIRHVQRTNASALSLLTMFDGPIIFYGKNPEKEYAAAVQYSVSAHWMEITLEDNVGGRSEKHSMWSKCPKKIPFRAYRQWKECWVSFRGVWLKVWLFKYKLIFDYDLILGIGFIESP